MPDHIDRTLIRIADVTAAILILLSVGSTVAGYRLGHGPGDVALTLGGVGLIVASILIAAARWIFGPLEVAQ